MPTDTPWLSDPIRPCPESRLYIQLLQNSIFAKIDAQTTDAQYTAAEHNIRALASQLAATIDWSHFGALTGTHVCIPEVAELASAYLANLRIWQVAPPATPTPPPPPQPERYMTPADVVKALRDRLNPQQDATPLGFADEIPDLEQPE